MPGKRFMPWFDNLNKAYQLLVVLGGLAGMLSGMLSIAVWVCVLAIDYRVDRRFKPLAMMLEFQFEKFGLEGEFEEFKARKEKQERAFSSGDSDILNPWARVAR